LAICGASAIAVTSPAVEAEPNGKNHDI
jgi:uncharacterized membrane protein YadS